jgi:glycosyltransferase involved in cell wall biosynthesis
MPLSFLEAMARGLPIVASRVGGVPEIVDDGQDGLLFPSGDEAAATSHLELLWKNRDLRETLGQRGRIKIEAGYGLRAMTEAYLRLYSEVIRSGK